MSDTVPETSGRGRRRRATVTAVGLALAAVVLVGYAWAVRQPVPPAPERSGARPVPATAPAAGGHGGHGAAPGGPAGAARAAGEYRRPVGPVLNPAAPVRLTVPDLRISTGIMRLGLQEDGTMEVPRSAGRAGWYERSPTPGALGPAVVAGHVTWDRKPDVFFELGRLKPGQRVDVARADGSTAVFEVTKVERYAKRDFPTEEVYGTADHAGLRLITCGGVFDAASGHYLDNVIAFARLVGSRAA